ncbi:MAG: hypothetical protein JWN02_1388 [Acidobacteria bacterium]|nr:hypothetical protein [Acidobacteriota bacterium]
MEAHIKEHPVWFRRFGAIWTPTVLIFDPEGAERWRLEGYLPKSEFQAWLEMGLARVDAMRKRWAEAAERYRLVVERYPDSSFAPEALYWREVGTYQVSHDHTVLGKVALELRGRFPDSIWAVKASAWAE